MAFEDIKVMVTERTGRKFWMAYYVDPISGKQKFRSTEATNRRDAERFAGKWEADLREGKYKAPSKVTWEEFTERFDREHSASLAPNTSEKYRNAFSNLRKHIDPKLLRDVSAEVLSDFQAKMREAGLAEATIASNLRHIKAALRWAADMQLIAMAPKVKMPKRVRGASVMRGRPITLEEFERMLAKVGSECGKVAAPGWERFLRGLWLSGLRLREALELRWTGTEGLIVNLDHKRPMLVITAAAEKGNKDRLLPMTPDFAAFLAETPEAERSGKVFPLKGRDGQPVWSAITIGKRISDIGKVAGVKVKDERGKVKFASAHDMRRAFGKRWSSRIMPALLKELMRHETIQTTMAYYVGRDADSIAEELWGLEPMNTFLNTSPESADAPSEGSL